MAQPHANRSDFIVLRGLLDGLESHVSRFRGVFVDVFLSSSKDLLKDIRQIESVKSLQSCLNFAF